MDICYTCGGDIKTIKDQPYKYTECGLDVVIVGIPQYVCKSCEESYVSIPNVEKLHRVIGTQICEHKKALLYPEEILFLRKDLHLKSKEFAKILGVNPSTVSRWENGKNPIDEAYDRLLRSIYMMYASEKAHHMVCSGVISLFKDLPAKRKKVHGPTEIILNPPEWLSSFGDLCPA